MTLTLAQLPLQTSRHEASARVLDRLPRLRPNLVVVPSPAAARERAEAAADLYRRHGPMVYRRCLRLLHGAEEARDATQEVFLRLVRGADRLLQEREDLAPWLCCVATNHCLNLLRDRRADREESLDELPERASEAPGASLDAIVVRRLLEQFDEPTRSIAVWVLVEGMDQDEVAQALGLSRRTVARKLDRFLVRARLLLGPRALFAHAEP
ncbi:MAG TPA: sigma-70 family RNA polymerase sigma factor [Anaeromyxobacteraceae bacterium]|nr:sigma-70 family RNA polymerase sigma factor [Anaeromyxobacteraceae bacterium]